MVLRVSLLASMALAALIVPACCGEAVKATGPDAFDVTVDGSVMSDSIDRGISQSGRRPSVGSSIEIKRDLFYVGAAAQSVSSATHPAAQLSLSGGIRQPIAGIVFDLGAAYYYYPGETLAEGDRTSNYWESSFSASRKFLDKFTLSGLLAYSPNIWNTGAWGGYASGKIEYELPSFKLAPGQDIEWTLAAELGRTRFGTTSPDGIALPSYTHWRLGVSFTRDPLTFDLSYHATNLNKENCFVLTGDPAATPGGIVNTSSNPDGLRSRLCGQALVGTLTFEFSPKASN